MWSNTATGFLVKGLMPHACKCARGTWVMPLICFNFWLPLRWSGSQSQGSLLVPPTELLYSHHNTNETNSQDIRHSTASYAHCLGKESPRQYHFGNQNFRCCHSSPFPRAFLPSFPRVTQSTAHIWASSLLLPHSLK